MLKKIWEKIKRFLLGIYYELKEFIKIAIPQVVAIIFLDLKNFAIQVVEELELEDISNEDKRKQALKKIKKEAKKRGFELKDRVINLLIELAINYIKNKKENGV